MIARSPLDEAYFGYGVARAEITDPRHIGEALRFCKDEGVRLLVARCPTSEIELVHGLQAVSAILMDTLLQFERPVGSTSAGGDRASGPEAGERGAGDRPEHGASPDDESAEGGSGIRLATAPDAESVCAIAANAFVDYTGHYHNDPVLRPKAAGVYEAWAKRCATDPDAADAVLVAEWKDTVVGFGALKKTGSMARGLLYGVHAEHRGHGVFGRLLAASIRWSAEQGATAMEYHTHLTNVAAARSVERLAFRLRESFYTFHRWMD